MNNHVKYLVLDVDGTLTDGRIYIGADGEMMKAFHVRDGYGIRHLLPPAGITPVLLTGRQSDIVLRRAKELGVENIVQACGDKREAVAALARRFGEALSAFAYMGDDLNDLPAMEQIRDAGGVTGCPSDADKKVKALADYISPLKGGDGAARDFIEWILGI